MPVKSIHKKYTPLSFPKGFLWGTATAAHQVEGGNNNNWTEWEKQPGRIIDESRSGLACDQYTRFKKDIADLARMHTNTYRFSIEWSRLEPRQGQWNKKEFDHYRQVLRELSKRRIKPMLTLHHFTHPRWFEEMGGFENPASIDLFSCFTKRVAEEFGDSVDLWCTINEPAIYAYFSYIFGTYPPGKTSITAGRRVLINLLRAHGKAYHTLHEVCGPRVQVGIAKHFRIFDPLRPDSLKDRVVARLYHRLFNSATCTALTSGIIPFPIAVNRFFPELKGTLDFLGVNYYSREMVRFRATKPGALFAEYTPRKDTPKNSLGWEIYPEGLYRVLSDCRRFGIPLYITENGTTAADDRERVSFLIEHLKAVHRAIGDGTDVRGYYYWSSLDNFEWAEGYGARFGLIDVDFKTQKRKMRESGRVYGTIAKHNSIQGGS